MCGRYTTAADRVKFDGIFKPAAVDKTVQKAVGRYNLAPTQQVAIIERTYPCSTVSSPEPQSSRVRRARARVV
jgi:putative SOS response-associated peptidase YedK